MHANFCSMFPVVINTAWCGRLNACLQAAVARVETIPTTGAEMQLISFV